MQMFKAEPMVAGQKGCSPSLDQEFVRHWDASCTAFLLLAFSVEMCYVPGSLPEPRQRNSSNSLCSKTPENSTVII